MSHRLRQRSTDESGFTLIELLVVVLIIGILAAVAIVSLLSQTNKAYDASAKNLAGSAQTIAETIATDNGGGYAKVTEKEINAYEKNIPLTEEAAHGGAWLEKAEEKEEGHGYKIKVIAAGTKDVFEVSKNKEGEVKRSCVETKAEDHGCPKGTW
jgi:prepilin-type N-terminal cleavage/methylation domain-containing protein